jgi:hypothetical protein
VRSRTSVIASGHRLIQSRASEIGSGLISRNRLLSLCSLVGSVSLPPSTLSTPRYHPLPCSYVVIVATRSLPLSPSLLACHYPPRTACSLSCRCCCCCCVVAITSTHQVSTTFSLSLSLALSQQSIERSFLSLSLSQPPPLPRLPRLLWILGCVLLSYPPPSQPPNRISICCRCFVD